MKNAVWIPVVLIAALILGACSERAEYSPGKAPSVDNQAGVVIKGLYLKQKGKRVDVEIRIENTTEQPLILRTPKYVLTGATMTAEDGRTFVPTIPLPRSGNPGIGRWATGSWLKARLAEGGIPIDPKGFQDLTFRYDIKPAMEASDFDWTITFSTLEQNGAPIGDIVFPKSVLK